MVFTCHSPGAGEPLWVGSLGFVTTRDAQKNRPPAGDSR
jgi:hypothetical protein